jgi:hypothetical protein
VPAVSLVVQLPEALHEFWFSGELNRTGNKKTKRQETIKVQDN